MAQEREVLTIQVGRYANHVGAHFWNFQDELSQLHLRGGLHETYRKEVLYRVGWKGKEQEEPTPRLLIFDTRDGLGCMPDKGLMGATGESKQCLNVQQQREQQQQEAEEMVRSLWGGGVQKIQQQVAHKNAFLEFLDKEQDRGADDDEGMGEGEEEEEEEGDKDDFMNKRRRDHPFGLDDSVTTWSDYLKCYTHPSTFQRLPFRDISADFDYFSCGSKGQRGVGYLAEQDWDTYNDSLRAQLEECDAVQGLNLLSDTHGGWGGLSCSLITDFADECRNVPISCFAFRKSLAHTTPTSPGGQTGQAVARSAVNAALCMSSLLELAPLTLLLDEDAAANVSPHLAVDTHKAYHTSSILAAALDTATSPYRFSRPSHSAGPVVRGSVLDWMDAIKSGAAVADARKGGGGQLRREDVRFGSLSAYLPLPEPDVEGGGLREMLRQMQDRTPPFSSAQGLPSVLMAHLGPPGASSSSSSSSSNSNSNSNSNRPIWGRVGDCSSLVCRGLSLSLDQQDAAMQDVLGSGAAGVGAAVSGLALRTPLPIPLSFPLVFRASVGERGEVLQGQEQGQGQSDRMMCDEVSVMAGVDASRRHSPFLHDLAEGLRLESALVRLALDKNGWERDDADSVREQLREVAQAYGSREDDDDDDDANDD